jgi:hypothetical protein
MYGTGDVEMKKERNPRRPILLNAIGFAAVLMLDFHENYWFVNIFLGLFITASIVLYILWPRLGRGLSLPMDLLAATVALVTGYDYFMRGSRHVYKIWFALGCAMLIIAIVRERRRRRTPLQGVVRVR